MSRPPSEDDARAIAEAAADVAEARRRLDEALARRDAAIVAAYGRGATAGPLAKAAGVHNQLVYKILRDADAAAGGYRGSGSADD
ncbi:hypothetical protein [Corynebacterium sp. 335C]